MIDFEIKNNVINVFPLFKLCILYLSVSPKCCTPEINQKRMKFGIIKTSFAFQLFDTETSGSLSAEQLSGLMGALLGVPQHNTAELYAAASNQGQITEGEPL